MVAARRTRSSVFIALLALGLALGGLGTGPALASAAGLPVGPLIENLTNLVRRGKPYIEELWVARPRQSPSQRAQSAHDKAEAAFNSGQTNTEANALVARTNAVLAAQRAVAEARLKTQVQQDTPDLIRSVACEPLAWNQLAGPEQQAAHDLTTTSSAGPPVLFLTYSPTFRGVASANLAFMVGKVESQKADPTNIATSEQWTKYGNSIVNEAVAGFDGSLTDMLELPDGTAYSRAFFYYAAACLRG